MAIEKFVEPYGNADLIFDPVPSYSGDWLFTVDNLIRNSKKDGKINLFQELWKEIYERPLEEIFQTPRILDFRIGMISKPNQDGIGRSLYFNKIDFFIEMTNFLNMHIDTDKMSDEERNSYLNGLISNIKQDNNTLNEAYHQALKEKMRKLQDVYEKEIGSDYFEAAMRDYAHYKDKIDFKTFIKNILAITNKLQSGMLKLGDFFDQKVDYKRFLLCFDADTFYLLFAKIIYEFNLIREQESGGLDNSYSYLCYYQSILKSVIKEDRKYNPKIMFTRPTGKKEQYSRWNFQNDLDELLKRHPEAKQIKLPQIEGDATKYKDISLMEKISRLYQEETKVNWEFLPEGERIKKGTSSKNGIHTPSAMRSRDELVEEVNMRIDILEASGYIGRPVKGLNTFTGYYAFIYPNGKVILEKFWENQENLTPQVGNATYVMTIDNFVEMSKMSKLNLIEYIKTLPEIGVKRIFHTSINSWQRNLYQEINGTYRLEDAIDFINVLRSGEYTHE